MIHNAWYSIGLSDDFPRQVLKEHRIVGWPIVAWRTRLGEVVALDGRCAHKRFPLWEGRLIDDDVLECGYHGFCYNPAGDCVAIPALKDRTDRIPRTARLHKYPVIEQHGIVWLWPGDPEQASSPPPATPEVDHPDWEMRATGGMLVDADYRLLIENLFDLTHFYPLHAETIGTRADAAVPLRIEREERNGRPILRTIRERKNFTFGPTTQKRWGIEVGDRTQVHELIGPSLVKLISAFAPPGGLGTDLEQRYILYQTITPNDGETHTWTRIACCPRGARWSGDPEKYSLLDVIYESAEAVVAEDRWAIEQQHRIIGKYPERGYQEVHIRTDGAVVMARRILDDLAALEERDVGIDDQSSARFAQPEPAGRAIERPRRRATSS